MKRRWGYVGISAIMAMTSIGSTVPVWASETEYESNAAEAEYAFGDGNEVGQTVTYEAEIEAEAGTVTLGAAITEMDSGDWEAALILQDSDALISDGIQFEQGDAKQEGRYPLVRMVNDEIFINGNNLAACIQLISENTDFSDWMERVSPEIGWICLDEAFLSSLVESAERLPELWQVESAVESWLDAAPALNPYSSDDTISFNETLVLALAMTLDQFGRECRNAANDWIGDLADRFEQAMAEALVDSGQASDQGDAEKQIQEYIADLQREISSYVYQGSYGSLESMLGAIWGTDLTGWLAPWIGENRLEGTLNLDGVRGKLTLTANGDTLTAETGGSEELFWARVTDQNTGLLASLVVRNDENEKSFFFRNGSDSIRGWCMPVTWYTEAFCLQDSNGNKLSGQMVVEDENSVVLTFDENQDFQVKRIRLHSGQETVTNESALEVTQSLDLDTLVYRILYEFLKVQGRSGSEKK